MILSMFKRPRRKSYSNDRARDAKLHIYILERSAVNRVPTLCLSKKKKLGRVLCLAYHNEVPSLRQADDARRFMYGSYLSV